MKKKSKILVVLVVPFLIVSCAHTIKDSYRSELTSANRALFRAPAEFILENSFEDLNSENLNTFEVNGQTVNCNIPTRIETFNNKKYVKYNVTDTAQLSCPQVKKLRTNRPWKVRKLEWGETDEKGFQDFVKRIGESKCDTTDKCISSEANILRTEEDMLNVFYSDCADWPYYLRAYYAYKNNLPFSFVREIMRVPFTEAQLKQISLERTKVVEAKGEAAGLSFDATILDLRYSRNGNFPVSRSSIPASVAVNYDFGSVAPRIVNMISSGFMRMTSSAPEALIETDFYSPKISSDYIVPGTVLYKTNGHVGVVYNVTSKGEVFFVDAHPDNSITRGRFNPDYGVYAPRYGGNFKNFRPLVITKPKYDSFGNIVSGQINIKSDQDISSYSLEQYSGGVDQKNMNFFDWVKVRLSGGSYKLLPIDEMKNEVNALCVMAKDRVATVQKAVDSGINRIEHPLRLPNNIYGADGLWESYSSPGSDIRLRAKMISIPEDAKSWIARYKQKDALIYYDGSDLKKDLIAQYKVASDSCKISYTNSVGKQVAVSLEQVIRRAALLSYDPYHCPELRWGATGNELVSCPDDINKIEWYRYQQFLRNLNDKDNTAVHGFTLENLKKMEESKSIDNSDHSPKFDILKRLQVL